MGFAFGLALDFTVEQINSLAKLLNNMTQILDLPGFTPREIVEMPECVHGEDEIPHGERRKVDEHPEDVHNLAGGNENEDGGKTKDGNE